MARNRTFVSRDPVVASWGEYFEDFASFSRWVMQVTPFDATLLDWFTLEEYVDAIAVAMGVRLQQGGGSDDDAG